MHVNAPSASRRGFSNAREQRVATPLRRNRPILDMEERMLESDNGVDPCQLISDRYTNDKFRKFLEVLGPERRSYWRWITVGDIIAVSQWDGKRDANADVAGCTCDCFGLFHHCCHALRIMAVINGGDPAACSSGERDRCTKVGIDERFLSEHRKPQFKRLVSCSRREGPQTAAVIVRVCKPRQHQKSVICK